MWLLYFDSHVFYSSLVLDPVLKLDYLNAAWEKKYLEIGMKQFKSQVELSLPHCLEPDIMTYFVVSCVQGKT